MKLLNSNLLKLVYSLNLISLLKYKKQLYGCFFYYKLSHLSKTPIPTFKKICRFNSVAAKILKIQLTLKGICLGGKFYRTEFKE